MNRNNILMLFKYCLILVISLHVSVFGQTYEAIEVDLKATVTPIQKGLNSADNDFSPVVFEETIYFTSDRNPDVQIAGENSWSKNRHVNIFQAKIKGEIGYDSKYSGVRLLSERLVSSSHSGPVALSITGDTLFFSRITNAQNGDVLNPQLCYVTRYNNKWTKPKDLPFNNVEAVYSHPFYDSKTSTLYFSSNKKGGKGGADLYSSQLTDEGWSDPISLDHVNTVKDEMFPFLSDGFLFYSQKDATNGLEVMWRHLALNTEPQKLNGANSVNDDFGLYLFSGMEKGYISSGRNGNDDIFFLEITKEVKIRNEMAGEFKYRTLEAEASDLTVQIVAEDGFVLYETTTDENGNFVFRDIDYDSKYSIKALTEEDLELSLKDKKGDLVLNMLADDENVFAYRKLGAEKSGTLTLIPDDMSDFDLQEGNLTAQLLYEDRPNEYPRSMTVQLIDEKGNAAFETATDPKGNFEFKHVPLTQNYLVKIPESEDDMVLVVYNSAGNIVAELKTNEQGQFTYRKLSPDFSNDLELIDEGDMAFELNEQTIWGYFEYDLDQNAAVDRNGMVVKAFTEDGKLVSTVLTDRDGVFRFGSLPAEKSLLFKIEDGEEGFILDDFTLYIYDKYGKKIAGLKRGEDGFFTYRPLGYELNNELSVIEELNLDFILGQTAKRKLIQVYFDSNESKVKTGDMTIITNLLQVLKENPNIKVEINAYADAKSSDEYNLLLSQKRGKWIVGYLTNKGVDKKRFIVNAYGETYLIDENNDALNRRAEIHLYE